MQKPTTPSFFVEDWPARYCAAPRRSWCRSTETPPSCQACSGTSFGPGGRGDLHGGDAPGVGLQHRDRVARDLEHLARARDATERREDEPRDGLVVVLGQGPVE